MQNRIRLSLVSLLALFAALLQLPTGSAYALELSNYERVLLPVVASTPLAGANGSMWRTHVTVVNRSSSPLSIYNLTGACNLAPCFTPPLPPESSAYRFVPLQHAGNPSSFVFVEPGRGKDAVIQLIAQDESRQALTHGTSIPVVTEDDLLTDRIDLAGIPLETSFRSTLRIYDFDATESPRTVLARWYSSHNDGVTPDELLRSDELAFIYGAEDDGSPQAGFIQIPVESFVPSGSTGTIRITITPVTPGLRLWPFVAVAHNETQHMTVIAP